MATPSKIGITIIGAGVSGLTSGLRLAEEGFDVRILAALPPANTTSAAAGASWGPYMATDPRVVGWSTVSLREFRELADAGVGVRFVHGMDAMYEPAEAEDWVRSAPGFRACTNGELPAGFACGWWYTIPIIEMPVYLDYLVRRFEAAGGRFRVGTVNRLVEVTVDADVVVNCTGLGARELVADTQLKATRGQLVVVKNPGVEWFFQDSAEVGDLTYFLPHGGEVVLGGSAVPGAEHLEPDMGIAAAIVERCAAIEPLLRDPVILGHRIGVRPTRPTVRMELELIDGRPVVHNYGHGGSGVTLSWGCAEDVLAIVRSL